MRSAGAVKGSPIFVPWKVLSGHMGSLHIGEVRNICPDFTQGLEEEAWSGAYRPFYNYALRLAQHYLLINENREDKLLTFPNIKPMDPSSFVFAFAIGGDEAPGAGTSYLVSFLNCGKRVASSFENFLIYGANIKETHTVVERYVCGLVADIKGVRNTYHHTW